MIFCGLNKTTLLDYPGRVAATIFLGGCNFMCPFCHNRDLVLNPTSMEAYSLPSILQFLDKRKNILTGVCITGGEPSLSKDLINLIYEIKNRNLCVKLDTNGYIPDVIAFLLDSNLLDYIAMDIKNCPEHYATTIGIAPSNFDITKIEKSISKIKNSHIDYEFRTTITKELHSLDRLVSLANWIGSDCKKYYIQSYENNENVINPIFTSYTQSELHVIEEKLKLIIPCTSLRGID